MAVGDAELFPDFLTPILTQMFPKPRLLFSHASAEVRGENTPERKFASTGSLTHNHQVMHPTRSPPSQPGGADNDTTCCLQQLIEMHQTAFCMSDAFFVQKMISYSSKLGLF